MRDRSGHATIAQGPRPAPLGPLTLDSLSAELQNAEGPTHRAADSPDRPRIRDDVLTEREVVVAFAVKTLPGYCGRRSSADRPR